MEALSNLKLLVGGGLVVCEAYDPFNSKPPREQTLFNPFGFIPAQILEAVETFLSSRTEIMLVL